MKQFIKHIERKFIDRTREPKIAVKQDTSYEVKEDKNDEAVKDSQKNKKEKKSKNMTQEEIMQLENATNNINGKNVKVVKTDRGLIERTESSKIILTEDNRQVLAD